MYKRIDHVALHVADLERSVAAMDGAAPRAGRCSKEVAITTEAQASDHRGHHDGRSVPRRRGACEARIRPVQALGILFVLSAYAPESRAQVVDLDALYERAASEGEVSAYLQGPPQVYASFVHAFEVKYPKVKVRITSGRYDLMPKIDAQIATGKQMDADLAILQTTQDYVRWKRQGALQNFASPDFDLIPTNLKDPEAQFMPVFLVMIGFAYSPAQVSEADAPRTIPDFLKPAFKGKIVSTYPHDDDLTLYSNALIVEKYGWGMIDKLLQQDMKFVRSHVLVAEETATGERPVTFDQISQFNKVRFVPPEDLPMPVYPITTGIFAKAPHPNAAKLFLAFAISKEQQQRVAASGAISVRPDVDPPNGLKQLSSYRTADGYIEFISDESRTKELRHRFESHIGKPQGAYISTSPNPASK